MRFCDHVVRFHITERHWVGQTKSAPGSSGTALALMDCFDAAIEVVLSFATDLADHGILPYAQDMVWIASSSAAIWIKRICRTDAFDLSRYLFFHLSAGSRPLSRFHRPSEIALSALCKLHRPLALRSTDNRMICQASLPGSWVGFYRIVKRNSPRILSLQQSCNRDTPLKNY
jgi:hypothetical protein